MLDTSVFIEISCAEIYLADISKYCNPQPQLSLYVHDENEIYRSQESRKDLDVFIAFRNAANAKNFSKHQELTQGKELQLKSLELETIALKVIKDTLVMIDPEWSQGFLYDGALFIKLRSYRDKDT